MIYNIYIFNRRGNCLFYKEYTRPFNSLKADPEEDRRLVFGMLFSMKDLSNKLAPGSLKVIRGGSFNLHHFQSVTGIMIVVNTDARTGDIQAVLQQMYLQYVDLVVHNPLAVYKPDEPISSPLFGTRLDEYLSTQPFYK